MDDSEFRHLVGGHEISCRDDPRRFARDTALLAGLGQASFLMVLVLAGAGLFWALGGFLNGQYQPWRLMLAAGSASLLLSICGALWSRSSAPSGQVITAAEAPALFKLIERLRQRCGGQRLDQVLLDGDLNAGVAQQPRLGVLGWHRNTLILGLPLLMALDVKQFAAVLAHEFGHLRGNHGKMGAWVYRTRRSWLLLAQSRGRSRWSAWWIDGALNLFFQYFFPRFNARAFVLSRQQEIEADQLAHQAVGHAAAAQGLIAMAVQQRYLTEHFWPRLWATAERSNQPQAMPLHDMRVMLKEGLRHADGPRWLREALKVLPDLHDTHPSLRDRLALAEAQPSLPPPPALSAAEQLLGSALPGLIETLDARWRKDIAPAWLEMHKRHRQRERLLVELTEAHAAQALPLSERLLWARTAWQAAGAAAALPLLRDALASSNEPTRPAEARYLLALALLDGAGSVQPLALQPLPPADFAEALALLNGLAFEETSSWQLRAGSAAPQWKLPAARRLEIVLEQREDFETLKRLRHRLRELGVAAETAAEVLQDLHDRAQVLRGAQLGPRLLRPVLELLRLEPAVGRAWLLCKTSPDAPGWELHLLVIERSRVLGQPAVPDWGRSLQERIELPVQFMLLDLADPYWNDEAQIDLLRQLRQTPGACIYTAKTAK